jgi:hypothetical protein
MNIVIVIGRRQAVTGMGNREEEGKGATGQRGNGATGQRGNGGCSGKVRRL